MSDISYSAVILDKESHDRLVKRFKPVIPSEWKIYAHHMTIKLGEIPPEYVRFLDIQQPKVELIINTIAGDEKVMAVGVSSVLIKDEHGDVIEIKSQNKQPHITLAVNSREGGKPVMSNYLKDWDKLTPTMVLFGVLTEVKRK